MKLSYRGIHYDTQLPVVVTIAGKVIGKYRGLELHEHVLPIRP
jgi:Domain of unknown function (DUF4278)